MFIIKILLVLVALLPSESNWQRIKTSEHISFLFPYQPEKLNRLSGNIPSTIYQTKNLACVFGVVCSNFSGKIDLKGENAQKLYEQLKKGSIEMETAKLKSEETISYENMLIKEIVYTIFKDNYEMTYFKRFIFRDEYVYQLSIGGRTRHLNEIKRQRELFFNSVNFPKETQTPETKLP